MTRYTETRKSERGSRNVTPLFRVPHSALRVGGVEEACL